MQVKRSWIVVENVLMCLRCKVFEPTSLNLGQQLRSFVDRHEGCPE